MNKFERTSRILAFLFASLLLIGLASAATYPYANYYGPSGSDSYYKETKSVSQQDSKVISDGDFYSKTSSSFSEKTTKEQRIADTSYNDYYKYNPNRYYANHFDDYQYGYPRYTYRDTRYPYSSWNYPTITYLDGDHPYINGFEHYYDNYYYQPQYDWHLGYYNWNY